MRTGKAPIECGKMAPETGMAKFSCFPAFELNSLKYNKFFFFFTHILNTDRTKFVPSVPKKYVHHYETGKVMAAVIRKRGVYRFDV